MKHATTLLGLLRKPKLILFMAGVALFAWNMPVYALPEAQSSIFNRKIYYYDHEIVEAQDAPAAGGGAAGPITGCNNAERIWNFLTDDVRNLTPEQAAGLMGNLQLESGFDPFNQQNGSSWPSGGWGIAQWTNPRRRDDIREAVIDELGERFYVPTEEAGNMVGSADEETLLSFQINYLYNESVGRSVRSTPHPVIQQPTGAANEWAGLQEMNSVADATYYWEWNFERPGIPHTQQRIDLAETIFNTASTGNWCG